MAKTGTPAISAPPGDESTEKTKSAGKGGKLSFLLLILLSLALIVVIKHSFIFLMIGMMPSIISYLIDPHPRKLRYKIIRNFNLAGVLPSAIGLVQQGNTIAAVHGALSNPYSWAMMYGAAVIGFLIVWLAPAICYLMLELSSASQINRLKKAQETLQEEWGTGISGKAVNEQDL